MVMPALLAAAALSGCAGNAPQLPSIGTGLAADTASTATSNSPPPASIPGSADAPPGIPVPGAVGSATEIYSHIASGAMACWFSVNGPLKKDYIFHAAADPPSRGGGGKAVITIHERDPSQPNPRGIKAYIVEILPTGEASAHVTVENRKMTDVYAAAMKDDISRWSKGEDGCSGPTTAAAWPPRAAPVAEAASKPAKTAKKAKKPSKKLQAARAKDAPQSEAQR